MLTSQFYGKRLTQAREYRQMTKLAVAELTDVVSSTVSKWESGETEPRPGHIDRLSELLGFDRMFFYRPVRHDEELDFWRSQSQATRAARERAKSKLTWLKELTSYAWKFFETPTLNLPDIKIPENFEEIDDEEIERIANDVRAYWKISDGPINHVVRTLEKNGIIVARCDLLADKLDALSEFKSYPFVVLSSRKASAARSRFDAAHELGHIVMHRRITRRDLNNTSKFSIIEEQAHRFAGAFLLSAKHFVRELWSPSLQALRERKEEWGASISCMLTRCLHLGLVSDVQYRRLNVQISKHHWRTREPLDDKLSAERPRLLAQCFESLIDSNTKSRQQILRDLRLPAKEIEELCCLKPGFFDAHDSNAHELEIISLNSQVQPSKSEEKSGRETIIEFKLPFDQDRV
jgi:Zn-dependent peptidase ImmA (M78 family)